MGHFSLFCWVNYLFTVNTIRPTHPCSSLTAYLFTLVRFTTSRGAAAPEQNFTPRSLWAFYTEEEAENWCRITAFRRQCEWCCCSPPCFIWFQAEFCVRVVLMILPDSLSLSLSVGLETSLVVLPDLDTPRRSTSSKTWNNTTQEAAGGTHTHTLTHKQKDYSAVTVVCNITDLQMRNISQILKSKTSILNLKKKKKSNPVTFYSLFLLFWSGSLFSDCFTAVTLKIRQGTSTKSSRFGVNLAEVDIWSGLLFCLSSL